MKTLISFMFLICFLPSSNLFSQIYSWYTLPNAPFSGRFEDLHFINASTGWLISLNGTIHKTSDGGESWALTDSVYQGSFRSVYFLNANTGWVGSLNTNFILYKTTNGGIDLTPVSNIPTPKPMGICGLHGIGNDFIYGCGTYQDSATFIKSTDGGNTWITKRLMQYTFTMIDSYFFNKDTGIAIGGRGSNFSSRLSTVLYTSDGGVNWTVNYLGSRPGEWGWKISFTDNQNGFVSLERLNGPKFFTRTSNGGLNWTEHAFENFNEQGIGFINPNTGWIGGDNQTTYGTTNGGLNWFNANIGMNINRFFMFGDTLGYACGQTVYKYSKSVGITVLSTSVPENYSLSQNYPNPFNPVTKVKFDIPSGVRQPSNVKLIVFDGLGKEVVTLVNEQLSPGSYEAEFDGSNFASGIYFYKLEAGSFVETKRMIMLK